MRWNPIERHGFEVTRITALILRSDENVFVSHTGPDQESFGIYIGTYDESPSGCKRPRTLITSRPVYPSADAAEAAGQELIAAVKAMPESELF